MFYCLGMSYIWPIFNCLKTFIRQHEKRNSKTKAHLLISHLLTKMQTSIVVLCDVMLLGVCKLFCTYGKSHYCILEFTMVARALCIFIDYSKIDCSGRNNAQRHVRWKEVSWYANKKMWIRRSLKTKKTGPIDIISYVFLLKLPKGYNMTQGYYTHEKLYFKKSQTIPMWSSFSVRSSVVIDSV